MTQLDRRLCFCPTAEVEDDDLVELICVVAPQGPGASGPPRVP